MAGGLAELDAAFPPAEGDAQTRLRAVYDYLTLLLENLRYILRHLSEENFDDAGLRQIVERTVEKYPEVFDAVVSDTVITDELCADYGEIADLTVDELRTDHAKAARYLAGNTAPLDWLHIHDEEIDFLTGTVRLAGGVPAAEQLHRGARRFWWTDAGQTHMTSLTETPWPVMVYQYDTLLKGSFRFRTAGDGTLKLPVLVLGAGVGDAADPDLGRGFLRKDTDRLALWLHGARDNGVFIGEYTDLAGLRRTTEIDFSGFDGGSFSETLDGGLTAAYAVTFDALGRPVKLTDGDGHETAVVWE